MKLFDQLRIGPPKPTISDTIDSIRRSESIRDIPIRLVNIINRYDSAKMDGNFRKDIFSILNVSVSLAEALADESYPVDTALVHLTELTALLPRFTAHLVYRPTTTGYGFMDITTGLVLPQASRTKAEAMEFLRTLQALGAAATYKVVPVQITSQQIVQPAEPSPGTPRPTDAEDLEDRPIDDDQGQPAGPPPPPAPQPSKGPNQSQRVPMEPPPISTSVPNTATNGPGQPEGRGENHQPNLGAERPGGRPPEKH